MCMSSVSLQAACRIPFLFRSLYRNDLDIVAAGVFMDLPNIVDMYVLK